MSDTAYLVVLKICSLYWKSPVMSNTGWNGEGGQTESLSAGLYSGAPQLPVC